MIDVLGADDPAWDERLADAARDVYHSAGYHRFSASGRDRVAQLAVAGTSARGFAWPYILRRIRGIDGLYETPWSDVDSVYGYPGPLIWGCDPSDGFVAEAWAALQSRWREQRVVAAFTRFHPLLGNARIGEQLDPPEPAPAGPVLAGGSTVSIDCRAGDSDALAGYARVLRQEIARARRAGLRTEHDEHWAEARTFVRLYDATMDRNRAADSYRLSAGDVTRLRSDVDPHAHLLITHLDGKVIGAGIFTEFEGIVQAHLVGTDDEYRKLSPLKVLLDDARVWARRRGNRVLHLGGGRGGRDDSLFAFKARFSPRRHEFHTGRWIIDAGAYGDLVATREARLATDDRVVADSSWFPAYRAPVVPRAPTDAV